MIFVCERIFDALPLLKLLLLIPEVTVAEDFDPLPFGIQLVRFESVRLITSVSHSAIELFAVEFAVTTIN